ALIISINSMCIPLYFLILFLTNIVTNITIATAITAYVILEYISINPKILSQFSPSVTPIIIRMIFQINVPINVKVRKRVKFILDIPAGIEIKLLISGIILQNSTVQ